MYFMCVCVYVSMSTRQVIDKILQFLKMGVVLGIKLYLVCTFERLKLNQFVIFFYNWEKQTKK